MEIVTRKMPLDFTIVDTSCWHLGSLGCHKDGIRQLVEKVATRKNYFLIHKGDMLEAIRPNDKRFAATSIDTKLLTPGSQAEEAVKILKPIRKKILAIGLGNHEWDLINTNNFPQKIASELGAPYGSVVFKFVAQDSKGKTMFKILSHHGRKHLPKGAKDFEQRKGNREAALKRYMNELAHSDCIYLSMGHDHSALFTVNPSIDQELHLVDNGRSIKQHRRIETDQSSRYIPPESRWYGVVGCLRKGLMPPGTGAIDYGEIGMFGPAALGWVEVHVNDGKVSSVESVPLGGK